MLEVQLLGSLLVAADGVEIAVSSARQRALLARMALAGGQPVGVDRLVEDVWGEASDSVLNTLQVTVSSLRKLLGPSSIRTVGRAYGLGEGAAVDAVAFGVEIRSGLAAVQAGDDIAASAWFGRGLPRWRGIPLEDLDGVVFDAERVGLTDLYLAGQAAFASVRIRRGEGAAVATDLGPLVAAHPYHEHLRAELVLALGAAGRQVEALAAYERARLVLVEEFGVDPGPELRAAHDAVLRNDFPATVSAGRSRIRLGLSELPGRIIGRDEVLDELLAMCADPSVRLLTILGPAGVGKTRLAEELVTRAVGDATFVSLLPAERPDDVAATIATSLGIALSTQDAAAAVVAGLAAHQRELLLVLDNFEHVLPAAKLVDRLLREIPNLTVVVTSRSPLGLRTEQRLPLEPLAIEGADGAVSDATLLLVERMRRNDPHFVPTAIDLADAHAITSWCDGLPLAIEIAAARTTVWGLTELRRRFDQPLAILVSPGSREGRNSSVQASIEWSMNALPRDVAHTLAVSTVFRGGFTAAALASVAGIDEATTVEHLHMLLERSLLRTAPSNGLRRFDLLQVVREVAAGQLNQQAQAAVFERHDYFYRDFIRPQYAAHAYPHPDTRAELELIAVEQPNIRAATRRAATMSTDLFADLVISVGSPWYRLGPVQELLAWIRELLDRDDLRPADRVDLLLHLLVQEQLGPDDEDAVFNEAVTLVDALENDRRLAHVSLVTAQLDLLGSQIALDRGDVDRAAQLLAAGVEAASSLLSSDARLRWVVSVVRGLHQLGLSDFDHAISELRNAYDIAIDLGLEIWAAMTAADLSEALLSTGKFAEVRELTSNALTLTTSGDLETRGSLLSSQGIALLDLGDVPGALALLQQAVSLLRDYGSKRHGLQALLRLAAVRVELRPDDVAAGRAFGLCEAAFTDLRFKMRPSELLTVSLHLARHRDATASTALGQARIAGAAQVALLGVDNAMDAMAAELLEPFGAAEPAVDA